MSSIFTTQLTSTKVITINNPDGVSAISVQANPTGGSFNFLGNFPFQNMTPNNLLLSNGQGVNLFANANQPLSNITIEWVSGTVDVIISLS